MKLFRAKETRDGRGRVKRRTAGLYLIGQEIEGRAGQLHPG